MRRDLRPELRLGTAVIAAALAMQGVASAQVQYRIERIASGLNQPTYVSQAPGDPSNVLYYTERTLVANSGFGASNQMGRVWRYDVDTGQRSLVLDLSSRSVTQDTGLQTIAFAPGFNTLGAPGYQKMYVSSADVNGTARNKVEEYTIGGDGTASFTRLILQYQNNAQLNHTVNWIGFDPTAAGAERGYLYISTGDGSFGNDYNAGTSTTGRPSQNPSDVAGKMLRVDIAGGDAYPADALKNFAIPATNPIPTYNVAHPGAPIMGTVRVSGVVTPAAALGEVWLTGIRNTYRASFDRANGDLWMGDVGETAREEVNFLKAGTNVAGPPVDYGWPRLEGSQNSNVPGAGTPAPRTVNPFTGVTSLRAIDEFTHSEGLAIIGGYNYRGPLAELQGKYFYSDFAGTGKLWQATFDRNTAPASYNTNNTVTTEVSTAWQALVVDPRDPSYLPESTTGSSAGIDHIVSFGEDNAGNMYMVDFGNGAGFDGQYPGAGRGEIFRLTRTVNFTATVNRDSGTVVLKNTSGAPLGIRGYSLSSFAGSLDSDNATPIAGNYDAPPGGGNGSVDPDYDWQVTSAAGSSLLLREGSLGDDAVLSVNEEVVLSGGDLWLPSIYEDVTLHVTLADGTLALGSVSFTGHGGVPFGRSDFDGNNTVNLADWHEFVTYHATDLSGLTLFEKYTRGDLDGDGDNDFDDFRLFQDDYDGEHGVGALVAALAEVPEPAGLSLALAAAAALVRRRRG